MKPITVLLLVVYLASTSSASAQARSQDDRADSLRPRYAYILNDFRAHFGIHATPLDSIPIDSIILRHGSCFGTCPVYTVVLYRDGRVRYVGGQYAVPSGEKKGSILAWDFARLSYLAEYLRFAALDSAYAMPATDMATVWITVGWRDRAPQTVRNYGDYGPPQLWAFQVAIEELVRAIRWEPR